MIVSVSIELVNVETIQYSVHVLSFFQKHPDWSRVQKLASVLRDKGHQVVLAGGCVRDAMLGEVAKDLDVATDATPEDIEQAFDRVVPVGKAFGVCQVVLDGVAIEVATFREEDDYRDGRRPQVIRYSSLEKDALRRDFTVNAMFFDLETSQVIDLVGGEKDLRKSLLRTVGDPEKRFSEDHLRVLRGLRFSAQLNFKIEDETKRVIRENVVLLRTVSKERVLEEFNKAFSRGSGAVFLSLCREMRVFETLCEDWCWDFDGAYPGFGVREWSSWEHMQKKFESVVTLEECWFELSLHFVRMRSVHLQADMPVSFEELKKWLTQLKVSKKLIKEILTCFSCADIIVRHEAYKFENHLHVARQKGFSVFIAFWVKELRDLGCASDDHWPQFIERYFKNESLPEPLVVGEDLKVLGLAPGPLFKSYLEQVYSYQVENFITAKEKALQFAKKII